MAFFDNFKKKKVEAKSDDVSNFNSFDQMSYMAEKTREFNSSQTAQNINNSVSGHANLLDREIKEANFDNYYGEINDFKNALLFEDEYGIKTNMDADLRQRYEIIINSNILGSDGRKNLFLPYLLEREELGIITDREKMELNQLRARCDVSKVYRTMVMIYQMLGFGDLRNAKFFEKSFEKYGNLSDYNSPELIATSRKKLGVLAEHMTNKLGLNKEKNNGRHR